MKKQIEFHNVIAARNGKFVALFREDGDMLKLWRHINRETYGWVKKIYLRKDKLNIDIDDKWRCNETARIPKGYMLNNKSHLILIDKCLGGHWEDVRNKLIKNIPLK